MVDKEKGDAERSSFSGEGDPSEMSRYLEILEREPSSLVFAALAEAYRKRNLLTRAIEVCRRGLRTHPNFLSGRVALARAYADAGKSDLAQRELEKVVASAPDNLAAQRLLAEIHRRDGRLDQLEKTLHRILSLDTGDAKARQGLAWVDAQRRQRTDVPLPPARKGIVTRTLAEIYASQGCSERAIEIYRELSRLQPENASFHERLADLQDAAPPRGGRFRGREEAGETRTAHQRESPGPALDNSEEETDA